MRCIQRPLAIHSLLAATVASMFAMPLAFADDLAPPAYRGQPLTIVAKWEFATSPPNPLFISPDSFASIAETGATLDTVAPHAEITASNWMWAVGDGNGEIRPIGGPGANIAIAFKLPNWLPPHAQMPLRVQITYSWALGGAPGFFVTTESIERLFDKPPGANTLISYPGAMAGGGQLDNKHFFQDWILTPSWHFTNLVIVVPFGAGLDEVVIDTGITRIIPANDLCAQATVVGEGLFPFSTLDAATDGPALSQNCDEGFGVGFIRDVWFKYTPTCDGTALITACDPVTNYDTRLAVYTGNCGALQMVACNDDLPNCPVLNIPGYDLLSTVNVDVTCGETYWIRLGGYPGQALTGSGTGNLFIACLDGQPCPPPCPPDLDGSNSVDGADLAILLGAWGPAGGIADLDGDGAVGGADLAILLGAWGPCP